MTSVAEWLDVFLSTVKIPTIVSCICVWQIVAYLVYFKQHRCVLDFPKQSLVCICRTYAFRLVREPIVARLGMVFIRKQCFLAILLHS